MLTARRDALFAGNVRCRWMVAPLHSIEAITGGLAGQLAGLHRR